MRTRAAPWSCRSPKVGAGSRGVCPGRVARVSDPLGSFAPPVPAANLTGHEEKVSVENFALLKVLGTGGEKPRSLG